MAGKSYKVPTGVGEVPNFEVPNLRFLEKEEIYKCE